VSIVRRAPFSDNPVVGERGQRARQRILDAALQVFGDVGYHQTGIARITDIAGCTRASFYQYFSSKEDVFRQLAGDVARLLLASANELEPITPDAAGWKSVRGWVETYGEIYTRYEPVFAAFGAAHESDEAVASGAARTVKRQVAALRKKITGATLDEDVVDSVLETLLGCMSRTPNQSDLLRRAAPKRAYDRGRIDDALADVIHRTLFGLVEGVNVRPAPAEPLGQVRDGGALLRRFQAGVAPDDLSPAAERTRRALDDAARKVFVARGFHGTRVDDITSAAGLSHGAFYRYFENKGDMVRVLAQAALGHVSAALDVIPDVAGASPAEEAPAMREWLRRYTGAHAAEAALIRVWIDASAEDDELSHESAAALDFGRIRMARFLAPRRFGDVDADALLLLILLDASVARRHAPDHIDAAAAVVERGLLGL